MTSRSVEVEAARRAFVGGGQDRPARDVLDGQILRSWERSREHGVDPDRLAPRFLGHTQLVPAAVTCADEVFDEFLPDDDAAGCSLVLLDVSGIVRSRRDGDRALGRLLDGLLLVPGYGYGERSVGTTAAGIALHEQVAAAVTGPEHYHAQLAGLVDAAAPVVDPRTGEPCGVVWVIGYDSQRPALLLPVARLLARLVADRIDGEPHRRTRAVLDRLATVAQGEWALATDGDLVVSNSAARRVDAPGQRVLTDLLLASFVLGDYGSKHLDLPGGSCAEVTLQPVHLGAEPIGCLLSGGRAGKAVEMPESVRRQGSHVAPLTRRDYAKDLRGDTGRDHAEARIRANRELLSPYLRARQEVVASIRQGRNHLLIGEPGVGKRSLLIAQFRATFPTGRVVTVDCASFTGEYGAERGPDLGHRADGRPQLLLLRGMNLLSPVGARHLDEALRPLVALASPPLVVGCIDTPAVDATSPYGLLLRHFHEITRVPALRYRADEISEIALRILRRLAGRRSLRLSLQVIRVLEGYAWPGNISELEDVLRYVVARKPMGEVQPPDLPQLCFQGRSRRMSMLESAQCDAIIQALYESNGNRYKAAAMLGIARSSLYRKIDAFGISYIA